MKPKLWEYCGILLCSTLLFPTCRAFAQDSSDPGEALKRMVKVSSGGPYVTKAGVPITLHGSYTVADQTEDSNQLQMIGKAIKAYVQANGSYPPGALLNGEGKPTVSWRVLILPYLGEKALYERFDLNRAWDDPVNLRLLYEMPAVYRKSCAYAYTTETGFAGVQGKGSLFQNTSAQLSGGRAVSGTQSTQTIAVGPVGEDVHLPWSAPWDIDIERAVKLGSSHGFSGDDKAFTPLLFLDGSVHLMPNNVGSASMITWTHVVTTVGCACAPVSSVDAGLRGAWDLANNGQLKAPGLDATFLASKPGKYTVTLRVFDRFGNEYNSSTTVEVR